jgi:dTDP-4-dehydrorhamnose 3,5-epimerase
VKITPLELPEVLLIEPEIYRDDRGLFCETYVQERYGEHGIVGGFVQDNLSYSKAGTLRGLHYQVVQEQAKLVTALEGRIFDVAVDVRADSPTFGRYVTCELDAQSLRQVFIPKGFAHGFLALQDALVFYKCSAPYAPTCDRGVAWDDPALAIPWPGPPKYLSDKDKTHPRLRDVLAHELCVKL